MPRYSAWCIKTALVYLGTGFTLGALLLANKGLPVLPQVWATLPAHIEFLLLGWTVQLIYGVAFWILPRFGREPKRGNERLAWLAFGLLNAGVLWIASVPFLPAGQSLLWLGRLADAASALVFVVYAWPRVKAAGV